MLPSNLKGHYFIFGEAFQTQNFYVYSLNKVIIQTQKYRFFFFCTYLNKQAAPLENNVMRTLSKARKVAGSARYIKKKYNNMKLCCPFRGFIYF